MRIGIITHSQSSDNYGQVLQCYALQRYLRNAGHDAYLIRFVAERPRPSLPKRVIGKAMHFYRIFHLQKYLDERAESRKERQLSEANKIKNKARDFYSFRKTYLHTTDRVYHTINELRQDPPKANVYITGSDQVWHDPLSNPDNAAWFLQFGEKNTKRISYAASIGREIKCSEEARFKTYLSTFHGISLREASACTYCRSLGFDEATVVCDPTLLLSMDEFPSGTTMLQSIKPYVFFYTLNIKTAEETAWQAVEPEIDRRGWDIKAVGSSGYCQARNIIPGVENIQATVPGWLALIKNARFVVTTSFHGTVFCIKMHKPFMTVLLNGRNSTANDRLTNLLGDLHLSHHIYSAATIVSELIDEKTDWDSVDGVLDGKRRHAIDFLNSSLK